VHERPHRRLRHGAGAGCRRLFPRRVQGPFFYVAHPGRVSRPRRGTTRGVRLLPAQTHAFVRAARRSTRRGSRATFRPRSGLPQFAGLTCRLAFPGRCPTWEDGMGLLVAFIVIAIVGQVVNVAICLGLERFYPSSVTIPVFFFLWVAVFWLSWRLSLGL